MQVSWVRGMLLGVGLLGAIRVEAQATADSMAALARRKVELAAQLTEVNRAIEHLKAVGVVDPNQIIITRFGVGNPNSAGGVEAFYTVHNPSTTAAIKYVTVTMVPYNAVGDRQSSSIGGRVSSQLEYTGPLAPGEESNPVTFRPVWYNYTITCAKITQVEVIWVGGRTATYSGPSLRKILAPEEENACP